MTLAGRLHLAWIFAVVIIVSALTAASLTWIITHQVPEPTPCKEPVKCTSVSGVLPGSPVSTAYLLLKVENAPEDGRLMWEQEWVSSNIFLEKNKMWISVNKTGTYLIYVKVTYDLKKNNSSSTIDMSLIVDFSQHPDRTDEILGDFRSFRTTDSESDANLTAFFLLHMVVGNQISIRATPKQHIKFDETRPFSTYLTIVRYAD